jgi:TolA-binding protein
MGLATREAGDLDGAVLHYSAILEADPAHYLAESALESLSGIAATGYQVPNLARYRTNFLAANPNSDFEIAQAFASAKAPFNNREYELAVESLSNFIQQYPQSSYAQEANYMLGYTFEILEQDARAVERYEQIKSGPFRTKAVRRLADLSLQSQRFNEAILYYLELLDKESSSRVREKALIGLLEAYYTINDYEAAQQYINQIEEEKLSRLSNEAGLYQGKIYLARQQYQQAVVQFQEVALKASNSTGAEAQYLLGKTFRQLGDFDNSTIALIDVRNNFQSYTEWIYEAYLLIAENYISKGDTFQAKATLNSIVSNSISPEYQERAQQRLAQLEKNKNSGSK